MGFRKLYILKFKNASSNPIRKSFKRGEFENLKSILKSCLWKNGILKFNIKNASLNPLNFLEII